jgi:hypothetical protein
MKIGDLIVPLNRLGVCLEDARKIYQQFGNDETENEHIANAIGLSFSGGAFNQRTADLKTYGLINRRSGKISISELGVHATYGDDSEKAMALEKIIRRIPLWSNLLDKYGTSIIDSNFWVYLAKITNAPRPEAEKKAEIVRNAYMEDVKYLKTVEKPAQLPEPEHRQARAVGANDRKPGMEGTQIKSIGSGAFPFVQFQFKDSSVIIKDKMSLDMILGVLTNLKETIEAKEKNVEQAEQEPTPTQES